MSFAMDARDRQEIMKEMTCQKFRESEIDIHDQDMTPVCITVLIILNSGPSAGIVDLNFDSVALVGMNFDRRFLAFGSRQPFADQSTKICQQAS
jgi:hypothetical protein